MRERFYHVQDPKQVRFSNISKGTKGWIRIKNQKGNGIRHHHNFRADPVLGVGFIAARRIPCMCEGCLQQLQKPWLKNKSFYEQPRYEPNNLQCSLWPTLGPLNNWRLISITDNNDEPSKGTCSAVKNIFRETLQDRAFSMMSLIEEGNYGAIETTDNDTSSGYYIFRFRSTGYILQHGMVSNSERIPKGEPVVDITWLNPVPHTSRLYSHGYKDDTSLDTSVRIQHIVNENVKFQYVTSREMLPKSKHSMFKELLQKNTIMIDDDCHNQIIEDIKVLFSSKMFQ